MSQIGSRAAAAAGFLLASAPMPMGILSPVRQRAQKNGIGEEDWGGKGRAAPALQQNEAGQV